MSTERLALPNGDWAELTTRLNHAQARRLRKSKGADGTVVIDEFVATMTTNWSIRGLDGKDVPYPDHGPEGLPVEALDLLPVEATDAIFLRAAELFAGVPDPNDSAGTSPGSPSAPSSQSISN